jgi:predicted O-methyltransferase YrrM
VTSTSDPSTSAPGTPDPTGRSFDQVYRSVADVSGWMSRAQACRLWDRSRELRPTASIVEIGSFHGRSAIMLASAAPADASITTIDPHGGNDRGPHEFEGFEAEAEADHRTFLANLERAGVRDRVDHLRMYSHDAEPLVPDGIDLLYIDGAHRYAPALDDIRRWSPKVAIRGRLLIHDSFSAWGLTWAEVRTLFWSRRFRYVGRSGSMTEYERVDLTPADRAANLFRQLLELPYFARNLAIKVLIKVGLGSATRVLGGDGTWPY